MKRYIRATSTKLVYKYKGPVYYDDQYVGDVDISTTASSDGAAIRNIMYQIKQNRRVNPSNTHYSIDYSRVEPVGLTEPIIHITTPKCSYCNTSLTDFGQCPVCDLGEEDY